MTIDDPELFDRILNKGIDIGVDGDLVVLKFGDEFKIWLTVEQGDRFLEGLEDAVLLAEEYRDYKRTKLN